MSAPQKENDPSCGGSTLQEGRRTIRTIKLVSENLAPLGVSQTNQFSGAERRLTVRLVDYWLNLRWCERGPFFEDFRPSRNPVPWSNCFLSYITAPEAEPVFDHVGETIIALFKPSGTNLPDREWLLDTIVKRFGDMREALSNSQPIRRDACFQHESGAIALYRSVLLPFVDGKRRPTYII